VGTGGSRRSPGPALTVGTTYHVAATYDGTTAKVYVNGTLVASGAKTYVNNTTALFRIGASGAGELISATLDEVAFYGTALSSTRIAAHSTASTTASNSGTMAGTISGPTASFTGTATPPSLTGAITGTLPSPTAALSGTVAPPVTGTLTGTLPSPTAALSGELPGTGTLAGTLPSPTASLAGTVVNPDIDGDPDVLSGSGGSFTIDFSATPSHAVTFTPTFAGSLVMQVDDPDGWQATFTVVDSDGDDVQDDTGALGVVWDRRRADEHHHRPGRRPAPGPGHVHLELCSACIISAEHLDGRRRGAGDPRRARRRHLQRPAQ
jgi:hypothetical protein